MKHRIIQYFLIITIISGLTGGWFYYRGNAAQKINSSKVNNLTSGLVGYWTFDGADMTTTATDVSDNNNHGTINGAVTKVPGKIGQALNFDGSTYLNNASNPNLGITDITECAWIKPITLLGNQVIMHYSNTADGDNIGMRINSQGSGIIDVFDGNDSEIISNSAVQANNWNHICATLDLAVDPGGSVMKIYINGNLDKSDNAASYYPNTAEQGLQIGARLNPSQYFNGYIDEVRIYSRALSQSEITELYQQGQSKINASQDGKLENGLTGYWSFDGNSVDWSQGSAEIRETSSGNKCTSAPCHGDAISMTNSSAVPGKIGQALNFNSASSQYISTLGITRNYLLGNNVGAVSVWVRPTGAPVNTTGDMLNLPAVVSEMSNASFGIHRGTISSGLDKIWAYNAWEDTAIVGTTFTIGEWTHVIFLKSATQLCIYKNGTEVECQNSTARISPGALNIGKAYGIEGAGAYFNGDIDELRTYNRALSQSEITELYQEGQTKINASQAGKLTNGLVGYWPFDGNYINWSDGSAEIKDASGYNGCGGSPCHADALNISQTTGVKIGKIGQALDFNAATGANDRIDLVANTITVSNTFTVSMWIFTSGGSDDYGTLITNTSDGPGIWYRGTGAGANTNKLTYWYFGADHHSNTLSTGAWHHVVARNNAGTFNFYIDGTIDPNTYTGAPGITSLRYIGEDDGSEDFKGQIDEVRVYNRALSQSEVTELYNLGR